MIDYEDVSNILNATYAQLGREIDNMASMTKNHQLQAQVIYIQRLLMATVLDLQIIEDKETEQAQ